MLDGFLENLKNLFLGSIWNRFDENYIWVICIYDHHIFVSPAWLDWKSSSLVGVYLPCGHLWLVDFCVDVDVLILLFLYVDCWVECEFFRVWYWCPSDVGIESGRNLVMLFSVNNGHVDRLFFRMAFRSVLFIGLPMIWCKKLRVSLMVPYGRIALIRGSACFPDGEAF